MLIQVVFPGEEDASRTQKEASSFEGYPPRRSPSSLFEAKTVQNPKGQRLYSFRQCRSGTYLRLCEAKILFVVDSILIIPNLLPLHRLKKVKLENN